MFPGTQRLDIHDFPTSDMLACGSALRRVASSAPPTQEDAARRMTNVFFDRFRTDADEPAFALVRLYRTMLARRLPPDIRPEGLDDHTRCLVLLGTRGLEEHWNTRSDSKGHQVIGLVDEAMLQSTPMIMELFRSLGISPRTLLGKGRLDIERGASSFDVFHVEHAPGSPFIPAQEGFVEPFGIASVVGFGGGMPDGELFVMLGFSRITITSPVAERFNTMSLQARIPLAPLAWGPVYEGEPTPERIDTAWLARDHIQQLESLLSRQETQVFEQSRALEARSAGMRLILDHVSQGLLTLDERGVAAPGCSRIITEWFGQTPVGHEFATWLAQRGIPEADAFARRLDMPRDTEEPWPRLSWGARTFAVDVNALSAGSLVILTDVSTQRQVMEARAARALAEEESRAKSAFLARVTHELRTPLHVILGYTELVEEELMSSHLSYLVSDLQNVKQAGNLLLELISDLLDLSKIEAGRMSVTAETVQIDRMFDDLEHKVALLIGRQSNRLHIELPGGPVVLTTDPTKLYQILLNLLSNAAKFTTKGDIWLRAYRVDEGVRIEVQDTGIGIAADARERVFEAFEQAHVATRDSHRGTGLGLALVREFSAVLGGSVALESTPGEGSTFTLELPRTTGSDT